MPDYSSVEALNTDVLLRTLVAFKKGDFSVRLPVTEVGIEGKIADTLNDIFEMNERMAKELDRISDTVGKEGKIEQRASLAGAGGGWSSCVESVNSLIGDLMQPAAEIARVIASVSRGDPSQKMPMEVDGRLLKGEFARTARLVNTMVDQLNSCTAEVTRVAREVGTEGKLGGQAVVTVSQAPGKTSATRSMAWRVSRSAMGGVYGLAGGLATGLQLARPGSCG